MSTAAPLSEPSVPAGQNVPDAAALPAGRRLLQFEIRRVIGSGGFGIVYLAVDHSLERLVAIKEYLPAMFALRDADGRVALRSARHAATFDAGLCSFVNEARLLARFDHPSLVKVHHFWEAEGTAYMVMPWYQGATLRQVRLSMDGPPDEVWARRILDDLLGALEVVHAASVVHRDVAPDNIVLLPDGRPVLLDFGSARHVLAGDTKTITAVVKPAYAPIEQYACATEFRPGPWTDIYAVAATLHWCLLGEAPPTAAARSMHDHYRPLAARPELRDPPHGKPCDVRWLAALDWALQVKPEARPQGIAEWREALGRRSPSRRRREAMPPVALPAAPSDACAPTQQLAPPRRELALPARFAAAAAAVGITLVVVQAPPIAPLSRLWATQAPRSPAGSAAPPAQRPQPQPPRIVEAPLATGQPVAAAPAMPSPAPEPTTVTTAAADAVAPVLLPASAAATMPPSAVREVARAPRPRARPMLQAAARRWQDAAHDAPALIEAQAATSTVTEVVVARSAEVRDRGVVSRSAAGSVVQVSPAGPNRAAVYVAHPIPVSARSRGE